MDLQFIFRRLIEREEGQAMVEYAILIAVITAALVGVFKVYPDVLAGYYDYVTSVVCMPAA